MTFKKTVRAQGPDRLVGGIWLSLARGGQCVTSNVRTCMPGLLWRQFLWLGFSLHKSVVSDPQSRPCQCWGR